MIRCACCRCPPGQHIRPRKSHQPMLRGGRGARDRCPTSGNDPRRDATGSIATSSTDPTSQQSTSPCGRPLMTGVRYVPVAWATRPRHRRGVIRGPSVPLSPRARYPWTADHHLLHRARLRRAGSIAPWIHRSLDKIGPSGVLERSRGIGGDGPGGARAIDHSGTTNHPNLSTGRGAWQSPRGSHRPRAAHV